MAAAKNMMNENEIESPKLTPSDEYRDQRPSAISKTPPNAQ